MKLNQLLIQIVESPSLHGRWINSLSMMENIGARKISSSEHPTKVNVLILKHAAEEARHAYYLKKQLDKLANVRYETYEKEELLAPMETYHYLHKLDLLASRYIREKLGLQGYELRYAAYLLVTYAIEERADRLYPVYQEVLKAAESKISVRTIIAEEQGHLEEMINQMEGYFSDWKTHADIILQIEQDLFDDWLHAIHQSVQSHLAEKYSLSAN